jgi:hypothetical protein
MTLIFGASYTNPACGERLNGSHDPLEERPNRQRNAIGAKPLQLRPP